MGSDPNVVTDSCATVDNQEQKKVVPYLDFSGPEGYNGIS